MNMHVPVLAKNARRLAETPNLATPTASVRGAAAYASLRRATLEALGLPPGKRLSGLSIPALAELHDAAIAALNRASDGKRSAYYDAEGAIYDQILKSPAKTLSESVLQLQTIVDSAGCNSCVRGAIKCLPGGDDFIRLVKRAAELAAPVPFGEH